MKHTKSFFRTFVRSERWGQKIVWPHLSAPKGGAMAPVDPPCDRQCATVEYFGMALRLVVELRCNAINISRFHDGHLVHIWCTSGPDRCRFGQIRFSVSLVAIS